MDRDGHSEQQLLPHEKEKPPLPRPYKCPYDFCGKAFSRLEHRVRPDSRYCCCRRYLRSLDPLSVFDWAAPFFGLRSFLLERVRMAVCRPPRRTLSR